MNIIQIQARLKDLSDQQLQQIMQQGGAGMAPEYLVLAELNRRAGMRQAQAASQPVDDTTVAQEVMAAPGLPQAVGNQMAQAMRPEGAQQSTARFAEGGIVGLQGGGFPPLPVPKPDYVAMTPEQAEIKKSVDDFVAKLQAQYGSDSAPSPALSDTDARFAESFGITDRGDLATPMVLYDGNLGTRVGSNGRQDFEADDALFRLGYDPGRMFIADTTGPNHMGPMAYAPEGASSDSGLRAPDDSIISTPMFDYAAPAYAHEFRHRGLRDLYATYKDTPIEELASILGDTSEDPERDAAELKDFLRTVAGTGAHASYGANEGFVESYDNPETRLRYPSKVTRPAYATVEETLDYPVTRLDHLYQQRIAEHARRKNSPRQMVDALAKATQLKRFTQRYEDTFGQPVPEAMLNDYRVNELGLPAADADPERKKFLGLFAEGGIVQAFEPGGQIGMNSEYTLPRTGDPSAMDLERLRQFEEKYGSIPEATAPTQDRQSWSDWFFGLINPRSDAQRMRDAYVPTVEDSNMFGYAEGGIVQAYEDGGILGELNRKYTPGEIAAMLRPQLPPLPSLTPPAGPMGTINIDAIPQWTKEAFGVIPAPADTGILSDLSPVTPRTPSYHERFGPLPKERFGPTPANAYVSTPQLAPYTPDPNELSLISNQRGLGFGAIADALEIKDPEGARSPFARAIGDPLRSYFGENASRAADAAEDIRRKDAAAQGLMNNPLARQLGSPWAGGGVGEFFTPRTDEEFAQARQLKAIADALGQTDLSPAELLKVTSSEDLMRYAPILDAEDPSAAARQIYYGEEPPSPGGVGETVITTGAPSPSAAPTAPTAPLPTRGMPPTAPPTPAVVTPPTPTVAAPSVSLPAATPLQVGPAPKLDEKAYTQAVSSFGVPGGVSDLTRESRRNAMLALAKAGFALAGSKEVTAGGAIGEAAKTGIEAYEAGAKDIAAQKEARRKEGIAQARQEMLDRRAMSQEQYKRYMDTVKAQQAAAERGDTRAYRNAQLDLQKYGIEATMARAAMTDRAARAREAATATRLELDALQDELARLNDFSTLKDLSSLPKAQRTAALADINRRKAQIQARLDAFTGVSGVAGPPTPGVIDLTK